MNCLPIGKKRKFFKVLSALWKFVWKNKTRWISLSDEIYGRGNEIAIGTNLEIQYIIVYVIIYMMKMMLNVVVLTIWKEWNGLLNITSRVVLLGLGNITMPMLLHYLICLNIWMLMILIVLNLLRDVHIMRLCNWWVFYQNKVKILFHLNITILWMILILL